MATQEKLLKSLEILKTLSAPNQTCDPSKKKDKIQHCHILTEAISNQTIKVTQNFHTYLSATMEVLLQLCDDQESDVRIKAEECLNRTIRVMSDNSIGKVLIELHKGIKRNGPARSLRVALLCFSQLSHLIRLQKGELYVANLFPVLIKVSARPEEQIHETLAASLLPIMKALGCFSTDSEIKGLLKGFLKNVSNQSTAIRRCAATSILNVCLSSRKPSIFLAYVLHYLLDLLIPISDNQSNCLILGVMACLKNITLHLKDNKQQESQTYSLRQQSDNLSISVDKLLQIYELCLYYLPNKDHNVVNAALELLNILLLNCPADLKQVLTSESGINKSQITLTTSSSLATLRSPSQLSIATSIVNEDLFTESELTDTIRSDIERWIDESKLSVINLTCAKSSELETSISMDSKSSSADIPLSQFDGFEYKVEYAPTVKSQSVDDNLERLTLSDNLSERSFSYHEDERHGEVPSVQEIFVGSFFDCDVSLIYCARLIAKYFLLSGHPGNFIPDKMVRVSTKSLALSCLSSIIRIYPKVFVVYLDKNCIGSKSPPKNLSHQLIGDVMLYSSHPDPQLRGILRLLVANFISAVLKGNHINYDEWIGNNCSGEIFIQMEMKVLIKILVEGLKDESSHCLRQTIMSLSICLTNIADSPSNVHILPILSYLPNTSGNPYWLVKVALCELVAKLPYITIYSISGSEDLQNRILQHVLFYLLENEDPRVRTGAANAVVSIIPHLYYEQFQVKENTVTSKAIDYRSQYFSNLWNSDGSINLNKKKFIGNMPFPFSAIYDQRCDKIEFSLSKIVTNLYNFMLTATSHHFLFGCIEALTLLSNTYPTTVYTKAWNCCKEINPNKEMYVVPLDMFNYCIFMLSHHIMTYDLSCHLNLLCLSSNLHAGYSLCLLKPTTDTESTSKPWDMFSSVKFSQLTEHYLTHMIKLLNILHTVLKEMVPNQPPSKTGLSNLSSASPIKRRKSDLDKKHFGPIKNLEKDDKDKKESVKPNSMGTFAHLPHYMKIYDILRTAHTNYKITLQFEACEKFLALLKQTLHTFSVLMEVGTLVEFQGIAEEILEYFRCTFTLEAAATVECVQQLLKCLFGNNLTSYISEVNDELCNRPAGETGSGFYYNLYQKPYNDVSTCFNAFKSAHKVDCDGDSTIMGYRHRKDAKKGTLNSRTSDKILANYIRIFEPMVIKSLKHYTITADVRLQCRVLQLLNQLIQLRVNYCLLDAEQIFIGVVLKQFEYIEKGQIPFADKLIEKIFQFLVQLSYSKQHSKSIITIPKIIQLCDGLMASGQSPLTHCIPALEPIVENIFLSRNRSNTTDAKELETTRDVVMTKLLKLCEYPEVIDLIVLILDDSKYCNNPEKWLKWSTDVMDAILPMLRQDKIRLDTITALTSLKKLIFALEPSVFEPIDNILLILFQESLDHENWSNLCVRRLARILTAVLIVASLKEDILISKINELKSEFAPENIFENYMPTVDPLNVINNASIFRGVPSDQIFVRFVFKLLTITSKRCTELCKTGEENFFIEELSILLMYLIHIFQSGSHCKIAVYAISDVNKPQLETISDHFLKIKCEYPIVVFLWCYVLKLLNYTNKNFWSKVTDCQETSPSLNQKIVTTGGIIIFSDYMNQDVLKSDQLSWFLDGYVTQMIELVSEDPIFELVSSIHRNISTSKLFIDSFMKAGVKSKDPVFILKILKCVENTHPNLTGSLLKLLLPQLLSSREISVSRLTANLVSRKIELLLTKTKEEVHEQLLKEELLLIIESLVDLNLVKKYEALASLLNKLCTQHYDISPLEFDQGRCVNPDDIRELQINKLWYFSQIQGKVINKETIHLLSHLDNEELKIFMKNGEFPKIIFKECIRLGFNVLNSEKLEEVPALIEISAECLLEELTTICSQIPEPHQIYNVVGRNFSSAELEFSGHLTKLLSDIFLNLHELIPSVNYYVKILPQLPKINLSESTYETFAKFGVICLESINFLIDVDKKFNVNYISLSLNCCDLILRDKNMCLVLNFPNNISWLCSAVNSLYRFVEYVLTNHQLLSSSPKLGLQPPLENVEPRVAESCHQLYVLMTWLYRTQGFNLNIPKFILKPIKNIIISLSRLCVFNSYVLIPTQVWQSGWSPELSGNFHTQVPPLPIEFLQEVDVLEEFIYRITLLGWTSRQQFEETWMNLLSVLCYNPGDHGTIIAQDVIHTSSLAAKAITSLLVQTLYVPVAGQTNVSNLIHIPRHTPIENLSISVMKLRKIQDIIEKKHCGSSYLPKVVNVFSHPNFEKRFKGYSYGQMSVKYLLVATKTTDNGESDGVWKPMENLLENSGLDINSCLQFLLDFYTQIFKQQLTTPLRFLHEVVRSTVIISDLFTDKLQFSWMLEAFLELSKVHTVEDELLHQYLIVGISKAIAVLTPDLEMYDSVKKILVQYLKSSFLPSRISCLHGLLYILEGCKLGNIAIGGISDEMQIILPCAVEYVQCNLNTNNGVLKCSQEHTVLVWTLAFFLIENVDETYLESTFVTNTLHMAFTVLYQKSTTTLHTVLMKALERLLIFKRDSIQKIGKQIMSLALEKIKNENPYISVLGMQLLLSYMYIDCSKQLETVHSSSNPDYLMQTIEKVAAIFEHIKRGYIFEVEVLCSVLPDILNDFFSPYDILTKVIGEFLSPQQPHPKLLSKVVFQVFARAIEGNQLPLLQDWVVFSLSNFTQSLSISMATWYLTCFFISASSNEWLRLFFPHVQTRVGRYEYEDRNMLCIAGADFYKSLSSAKQKQTFVENFNKIKNQSDTLFQDLLSSL